MSDLKQIKEMVLNDNKYSFLSDYPIELLVLGGSWAYGTNKEDSDVDLRGILLEPQESVIGLSNFEQLERHDAEQDVDVVVYGLRKMFSLLLGNNPNCIEIISPQERNWIKISDIGKLIIDNRHIFLSKKAAFTFGAYAKAQLDRLENAMCHDSYDEVRQEEHLRHSIESMMCHFNERFTQFEEGSIVLRTEQIPNSKLEKEIVVDVNLKGYPLRDYKSIWSEMNNVVKDYSKLNGRNRKKDIPHLCKHMMHLVRLYLMGIDILQKEEIITYRENDLDLLQHIRNGAFLNEEGVATKEFYDVIEEVKEKFDEAVNCTKLPAKPNFQAAEKLLMKIYHQYLLG